MSTELREAPPSGAEQADDERAQTRQFVTFIVGDEVFGVRMDPVQEIIRMPDIVRVPLAPRSLHGLANLRGRVLPIISLRRIFGINDADSDESTRALVIDIGQPLGFVVDRIASVVSVEPTSIGGVEGIRATIDSDLLSGVLKDVGGFSMVMVLDFERLIAREFAQLAALVGGDAGHQFNASSAQAQSEDEGGDSDELQLVSFSVEGQEYAIDIASVQEIVQIPSTIAHVPNAPAHVIGLMTLRERLLPLLSLRRLFHLPDKALDDGSRVVVVTLGSTAVGLVTDSVSEVLRVRKDAVDAMPAMLARHDDLAEITQICRLDSGRRLVSILAPDSLAQHAAMDAVLNEVSAMNEARDETDDDTDRSDDEEQVVVFRLADGEFGVPIESVQEIVRIPEQLSRVPKAPDFVEGVINLRGTVLPVIDQRQRLGLPTIERNDRQRIMVFLIEGIRTGFIVDSVTEVLKLRKRDIEVAPRLSGEQARLLGRVANLEKQKRMIQLIEAAHLLDESDRAGLAELQQDGTAR
jgi:purine-binding chemotaxis protein CheW